MLPFSPDWNIETVFHQVQRPKPGRDRTCWSCSRGFGDLEDYLEKLVQNEAAIPISHPSAPQTSKLTQIQSDPFLKRCQSFIEQLEPSNYAPRPFGNRSHSL